MKPFITLALVGTLSVVSVYAQDAAKGKMMMGEPTPEMRVKMADMHQMMADCLKSTKPMAECKQEMMKNCPMAKDGGKCPMMGEMDGMMRGHRMGHGKGVKAEAEKTSVDKHE